MTATRHARLVPALAVLAVLLSSAVVAAEGTVYGTVGGDAAEVTIADLLKSPDAWVGKTVRVAGTVTDVCPRAGCWIDITDDSGQRTIRLKVNDGEIVFPVEASGKPVVAEGTFARIEMTEEQAVGWARHLAEERGDTFDPETDDAPTVIYRIEGRGARIE